MTSESTCSAAYRSASCARQFGTPMYVYDGAALRQAYSRLRADLHPAVDLFYSMKANPNVSVCALLRCMGAGMEVSSLGGVGHRAVGRGATRAHHHGRAGQVDRGTAYRR